MISFSIGSTAEASMMLFVTGPSAPPSSGNPPAEAPLPFAPPPAPPSAPPSCSTLISAIFSAGFTSSVRIAGACWIRVSTASCSKISFDFEFAAAFFCRSTSASLRPASRLASASLVMDSACISAASASALARIFTACATPSADACCWV